jgi:hypothetical protein
MTKPDRPACFDHAAAEATMPAGRFAAINNVGDDGITA